MTARRADLRDQRQRKGRTIKLSIIKHKQQETKEYIAFLRGKIRRALGTPIGRASRPRLESQLPYSDSPVFPVLTGRPHSLGRCLRCRVLDRHAVKIYTHPSRRATGMLLRVPHVALYSN